MIKTINSVQLLGRLADDPISSGYSGDGRYVSFHLATDNRKGVDLHPVRVYGNFSDVCGKHLRKGNRIYLIGFLNTQTASVIVDDLVFLDGR